MGSRWVDFAASCHVTTQAPSFTLLYLLLMPCPQPRKEVKYGETYLLLTALAGKRLTHQGVGSSILAVPMKKRTA